MVSSYTDHNRTESHCEDRNQLKKIYSTFINENRTKTRTQSRMSDMATNTMPDDYIGILVKKTETRKHSQEKDEQKVGYYKLTND